MIKGITIPTTAQLIYDVAMPALNKLINVIRSHPNNANGNEITANATRPSSIKPHKITSHSFFSSLTKTRHNLPENNRVQDVSKDVRDRHGHQTRQAHCTCL